jgi:hypothetical protein
MTKFLILAFAKSFFRSETPYNPPCLPLKKGGNYKKLQEKSPFEKGGFENLQGGRIYGKSYDRKSGRSREPRRGWRSGAGGYKVKNLGPVIQGTTGPRQTSRPPKLLS